ncbi:unnamed protein product [Closterium sp. Yama58-4]|nr:unnamed protein product [Closterium sp. Yama58-4]
MRQQAPVRSVLVLLLPSLILLSSVKLVKPADLEDALRKSILFFEQQRSGKLPPDQRAKWRGDSGLKDGKDVGVDLTKGYYDSGDNVKYGLPMAFTLTTLAWSVVEYGSTLAAQGQLDHALDAIRWGTDFFISAHPQPNVLYAQVGDGPSDHRCWQRPEDMTTPRMAFRLDASNPGTEVAAEAAAALAAASMAFASRDEEYSRELIRHAKELFNFANTYRKSYVSSIPSAAAFYNSYSGFNDELLWAAAWLQRATGEAQYLAFVRKNNETLQGATTAMNAFSWDNKFAGAQILLSKVFFKARDPALYGYQLRANDFVCATVVRGTRTPGGLLFVQPWSNLQYVTAVSLLLAVYSDYLDRAGVASVQCDSTAVTPAAMRKFVGKQMSYLLGENPRRMSYMVGYGASFPMRVHHRGASIVSIKKDPRPIGCEEGFKWFHTQAPNANVLVGAVVGGPDNMDAYKDERDNYQQSEVSTYVNSPLVGALARLLAADAPLPPNQQPGGGSWGGGKGKGGGNGTRDGSSGNKGGGQRGSGSGSKSGDTGDKGGAEKSGSGKKPDKDGKKGGEGSGDMKYRNGTNKGSGGSSKSGNKKSGNKKPGGNDSGSNKSGSNKSGSNKSGSNKSGSNKSGSNKSGSNKSGSNKSGSNKSGSDKTSNKSGSDKSGSNKSGSSKSGSNKSGSNKSGSNNSGFNRADSTGTQGPSTTFIASVRDAEDTPDGPIPMHTAQHANLGVSPWTGDSGVTGVSGGGIKAQQPQGLNSMAAAGRGASQWQVSVTTVVTAQWQDVQGRSMAQYMVLLRNDGTTTLAHMRLTAQGFHPTSAWGLVRAGNAYRVVEGGGALAPGQTSRFGYVQEGEAASFKQALQEEA